MEANQSQAHLQEHLRIIRRGVVDMIENRELEERVAESIKTGKPLRVKFGMDPTSADLHVGHAVPLRKLRAMQQLGHHIVLIVGDATAMVGDPSGRNKLRPPLSRAAVEENLKTYVDQAAKLLDLSKTEIRRNTEWFDQMSFEDVLKLCGRMTVARMIERDTFQKRIADNEPIGIHEFLYPLMQGWDSVMVRADLELGGTDQLFNLLRGRDLQREEGQRGQICFTTPLINGKVMSIEDGVMREWYTLLTDVSEREIDELLAGHPREAKARLAQEITTQFHTREAALKAREAFDRRFRDKEIPEDVPEVAWPAGASGGVQLMALLKDLGLCASTSEAKRLIEGGGVRLDNEVHKDPRAMIQAPQQSLLIQAGKRKFVRVQAPS